MSSPQDCQKIHLDTVGIRQDVLAPRKMLAITILVVMTQHFTEKLKIKFPETLLLEMTMNWLALAIIFTIFVSNTLLFQALPLQNQMRWNSYPLAYVHVCMCVHCNYRFCKMSVNLVVTYLQVVPTCK